MRGAKPNGDSERGQAYTLEGFVSAMVVLVALLFALQAVVITPTTGGLADRTVQSQLQQEAQDALVVAADADAGEEKRNLSEMVRYWDEEAEDEYEFYNTDSTLPEGYYNASSDSEFVENTTLGHIMYERFTDRGMSYNVELIYDEGSGYESEYLVYQGEAESVTASYKVTLLEGDDLTAPGEDGEVDSDADNPIGPHDEKTDSAVYNVVEVRVAVW